MMLKNRWKKGSMPDPYDYIYCLSWKSGRQGGRLLAGCAGNTLTGCYFDGRVHRHDPL